MQETKDLIDVIGKELEKLARSNAVVGKTTSVGDRHIIPLCELRVAMGGGGGSGEGEEDPEETSKGSGSGVGGGAGASVKAEPVAVILVDGDDVQVKRIS